MVPWIEFWTEHGHEWKDQCWMRGHSGFCGIGQDSAREAAEGRVYGNFVILQFTCKLRSQTNKEYEEGKMESVR